MRSNITYRPELDGLRGIAVISVVLYHFEKILLNSNFFTGGFIGVDIFRNFWVSYFKFNFRRT